MQLPAERTMLSLWTRLPIILRAILTGTLVAAAGTLPWAALVAANSKHYPNIPWAVPPTAIYLWLFWRYAHSGQSEHPFRPR